jgi:type VI secretion system secreted protein VgrG
LTEDHLTIAHKQYVKLGTAQRVTVGDEIHRKAGEKIVMEAGMELTMKAGGSLIKVDAGGVTVVGPAVKVNAGGSSGVGTGVGALVPGLPLIVDQARAGSVLDNKAVTSYYEKVQFVTSSGDPVEGLGAAFILPNKAAPVIFRSDAQGHSPQTKTDSIQTADVHLVWDDFGVPDGADDYERSRKK